MPFENVRPTTTSETPRGSGMKLTPATRRHSFVDDTTAPAGTAGNRPNRLERQFDSVPDCFGLVTTLRACSDVIAADSSSEN